MTKRNVGVALVFLVGCATGSISGQLVVPKSSAQQRAALTRWEYSCKSVPEGMRATEFANLFGQEGWELALVRVGMPESAHNYDHRSPDLYCFKRPK